MYTLKFLPSSEKDIAAISFPDRKRVMDAIQGLAENPRPHGALKMSGGSGQYRIRVGEYRIAYEIHDKKLLVIVVRAGRRDKIYALVKRR